MAVGFDIKVGITGDTGYRVDRHVHGIAIIGSIPVSDFSALQKAWDKMGYDTMDLAVGERLGGFAITRKKDGNAWRKALGLTPDNPDWLQSGDTGTSSKTIYAFFTGKWHVLRGGMEDADVPHDPDDFGRCRRLLARYPEWLPRLPELAEKFPNWAPLVREWARLTEIHDREVATGEAPELYKLMQTLRQEVLPASPKPESPPAEKTVASSQRKKKVGP